MLRFGFAAFVGVVVSAVSCRAGVGKINDQGYLHEKYSYRVAPKELGVNELHLMGPDWLLDNYYVRKGRFVEKRTNEYMERITVDADNDGTWEFNGDVPLYDLRFLHRNRDAVIWLRTLPLSGTHKDKDLSVLMHQAVESVAGAGYERVQLHPQTVIIEEKRFAAVAIKSGTGRIADTEAFFTHVDVANLDQLRIQPGTYSARVELVLLKPAMKHSFRNMEVPVLMIAAYKNSPDAFEQDLPAFREFLGRIEVHGQKGLTEPTFSDAAPAPAAPAAPNSAETPAPPVSAAPPVPAAPPAAITTSSPAPAAPAAPQPSAAPVTPAPAPQSTSNASKAP